MIKVTVIADENVWKHATDGTNTSGATQLGEGSNEYLITIKKALESAVFEVEKQLGNVIRRDS